jgi:hypothetical protein
MKVMLTAAVVVALGRGGPTRKSFGASTARRT